ncbi:MAG: hypothetical protein ACR2RE_11895, partial [Geminicoccaceae bacterium]
MIDFITLPSRSGEEDAPERCGASANADDDARAGCSAILRAAWSRESSVSPSPTSSLAAYDAPHHGTSSSSPVLTHKPMTSLDNFQY